MYSNVSIIETRHILEDIMEHILINPQIKQELLTWYGIIRKQNYFTINNKTTTTTITTKTIIHNDRSVLHHPAYYQRFTYNT
jgi:hypothetical protein